MSIGPRTYLIGQLLPLMLEQAPATGSTVKEVIAEQLDEAIRITIYIADLTLARMANVPYKTEEK